MTAIDLDALTKLADAADAVREDTPTKGCSIYYAHPGCAENRELLIAIAQCDEWAQWIAATVPRRMHLLLARLRAAAAVVACARRINAGMFEDVRMTGVLTAYDAAVAGREGA